MYEELVKDLRYFAEVYSICNIESTKEYSLAVKAADAIEELQRQIDAWVEPERKALIKSLPRWIPVTERLPEKNVLVLCACRANIFCVMKWDGVDWYENPTHVYMSGFVTHWMPLPEPPEDGAE